MRTHDAQEAEKQEYAQFLKELGNEIRAMRKGRGWTLRGRALPSLIRVAKALGLRPSELLAKVEEAVPLSAAVSESKVSSVPRRTRIGAAKRQSPK